MEAKKGEKGGINSNQPFSQDSNPRSTASEDDAFGLLADSSSVLVLPLPDKSPRRENGIMMK